MNNWNALEVFLEFILFIYLLPRDRIENFIDENKALMRRMYGDFEMTTKYGPPSQRLKKKRSTMSFGGDEDFLDDIPGIPDMIAPAGSDAEPERHESSGGDSFFNKFRTKRQSNRGRASAAGGAAGGSGTTTSGTTAGTGKTQGPRLNPGPTNTENTGR